MVFVPFLGELEGVAQEAVEVGGCGAGVVVEEEDVEETLDARGELFVLGVLFRELDNVGPESLVVLRVDHVEEQGVVARGQHSVVTLAVALGGLPACAVDDGWAETPEAGGLGVVVDYTL